MAAINMRARSASVETTASSTLCIICYERQRDTTLPCGHSNVCSTCIAKIASASPASARCPTCRAELDLPPALRRPGLQPVRLVSADRPRRPPPAPARRVRSTLERSRSSLSEHAAAGVSTPPPPTTDDRVVVLAQRGVAVDAVVARLRRNAASEDTQYMWVAAAGSAADTAVAARIRALKPTVLVLAFDVAKVRSFDAVLRWDAAVPRRLPRVWAALDGGAGLGRGRTRAALAMSDVRDAAHCLGARRTTVLIRLGRQLTGADLDVRRLADAVTRCFSAKPTATPTPQLPHTQRRSWIRQCL